MIKKLAIIALAIMATACTDSTVATKALSSAGYQNVEITGYSFFGCSEDDAFHTGFKATGQDGKPVEGVVCSGWFKGATIRLD